MKLLAFIPALLLAGCASHGSWLDQVGKPLHPPLHMSDSEAREVAGEAEALRARAEGLRLQLAGETDRLRRFDHYRALRDIGDRLVVLERLLYHADRPSRLATVQRAAS